ncbi:protein of unknown function [Acidithiobacillus ferrivorans]|uniref:Uncharacterized protein n=1 Tax=Acidithiobacillus ferrivorans TaxID=160808 RepID=A0A060UX32_9PROT|nr:hypothetical protein AFERRI_50029 [Acidithiobacillus ferrivorans]SMH65000.1 protein of unknown function [Acidithiobacillus ferrivorans]
MHQSNSIIHGKYLYCHTIPLLKNM